MKEKPTRVFEPIIKALAEGEFMKLERKKLINNQILNSRRAPTNEPSTSSLNLGFNHLNR